jgi:hypothetical protein
MLKQVCPVGYVQPESGHLHVIVHRNLGQMMKTKLHTQVCMCQLSLLQAQVP